MWLEKSIWTAKEPTDEEMDRLYLPDYLDYPEPLRNALKNGEIRELDLIEAFKK